MPVLAVMGAGMVTALGFNAPATLAALRAGVSAVGETIWVDYESGEHLQGAKVALPQWSETVGKLADLLATAIAEAASHAEGVPIERIPLLVGVAAADRVGRTPRIEEHLLEEVHFRLNTPGNMHSALFPGDQAGCAQALVHAERLLESTETKWVIVAGVDSFLHQPTLDDYIDRRRVMTPSNSNGFFPGEAGCAVLVGRAGTSDLDELWVLGRGFSVETATIDSTEAFRGRGMTEAVRDALHLAGVDLKDIAYRLTDVSGEHYKFKEALFAAGRLNKGDGHYSLELWHPIEYLGEIGAAILPCLLAQARHASLEGYAPGPLGLLHISADGGARAAFVVGPRSQVRGTQ